jgi:hypothetical protein
MDNVLA